MSREIRVVSWCDVCEADGEHNEGTPHEVSGVLPTPLEIDLCERHEGETGFRSLAFTLNKFGRAVTPAKRRPVKTAAGRIKAPDVVEERLGEACPRCGFKSKSLQSLAVHARRKHGLTVAEL